MKTSWTPLIVAGALSLAGISSHPAQAQSAYSVSASHAQGLTGSQAPVIHLWPGYGTNLSFIPTNESIVRVWIDDPSRVALDFDQPLCPTVADSGCVSGRPSVIHLRRVQGLSFENLPRASGTLLTVITETSGGDRRLYEFRIAFGTGEPDYHTVVVNPTSPIHPLLGPGDVRRGLQVAESRGLITPNQDLWNRLQTFLRLTQAQWRFVAELPQVARELILDPSHFKGSDRPAEKVSWHDAVEFCARLSQHTGRSYRLPNEAEWEYACRAGTTTPFHFGETLSPELANYDCSRTYNDGPKGTPISGTTPVRQFGLANAFGLCDMHGNVWEWCQDQYHDSYKGAPTDGSAWEDREGSENVRRIRRGGSWSVDPWLCRSAYRYVFDPRDSYGLIGFRVVCSAPRALR